MNTKQAKQLDFPQLLEKMGYQPIPSGIRKGGVEIWYNSPLNHSDKTPSFHISKGREVAWIFKCFSTGAEGNILDFVLAHEGGTIKMALSFLRDKFPGALFDYQAHRGGEHISPQPLFSFHQSNTPDNQKKADVADRELEFIQDLPLKSGTLLDYLEEKRKIPRSLAQQYLRLVRYKNLKNGKTYYAFGMKNRAGGFEIRAASDTYSFKSALVARDISIIEAANKSSVLVFEGMTDFLSYLVMIGADQPPFDAIILHSVNSYNRCKDYILQQSYDSIYTFLDNDPTGAKHTARFVKDFGQIVLSLSERFQPYKDLNDALKNDHKIVFNFSVKHERRGLNLS